MKDVLNIGAYRFVSLPAHQLTLLQSALKAKASACHLKGTILLSAEGVNLFLAGAEENIAEFRRFLSGYPELSDLNYRESWSDFQPFRRLLVRLKKEIISMGRAQIQPEKKSAARITPETLRQWYREGREMLVLDTRNHYEVELGTFEGAMDLNLQHFRNFPEASSKLPEAAKEKPVVAFCTGGIRCEKAALWLEEQGFKEIYQLQGGILNYLEKCGSEHFQGKCFVFDERIAINEEDLKSCRS